MPLLKDLSFVKIGLKVSTVVLQNVSFSIAGSLPPDPFASGGWDVAPKPQPLVAGGLASRPPMDSGSLGFHSQASGTTLHYILLFWLCALATV